MTISVNHQVELSLAHEDLAVDVRNAKWTSNCAGEIFVEDGSDNEVRIGHFQGDAKLARFVVLAHEAARAGQSA